MLSQPRRWAALLALALFVTALLQIVGHASALAVVTLLGSGALGAYLLLTHAPSVDNLELQTVFERAAVGLARIGIDGGWLEVNQAYCDIVGYSRRELLALTCKDVTHPEDISTDRQQTELLLAGRIPSYAMEKRYVRKGGSVIWVELVVSLVRDPEQRPSYFVASVIDISARKAAEQARDEARRFAEDLAFVSPALLYVYDLRSNRTVYASRATSALLGRSVGEMKFLDVDQLTALVHPLDLERCRQHLLRASTLADGEACDAEFRMRHADGSWRWLLVRSAAFRRDAEGRVVQTVGSALDVTALAKSEQEAHEARALVDALYVQAPIGLGYYDRSLRCVLVNETLAKMAGRSVESHLGRPVEQVMPGSVGRDVAEDMRRVIETGTATTGLPLQATTPSHPDERRDWIISYYPVRVSGAEVVGVGCIAEDITERRRIEREREQLVFDLREAVRARDDFLSIASHELRTPLTTLMLSTEYLVRQVESGATFSRDQLRAKAERLQGQGKRLERLVGTLLDVARIAQGRVELFPEDLDAAHVVSEQVDRLRENAVRSGSTITVHAHGPIRGRFDRTRLEQIVDNLISNAIKFGCGKPITVSLDSSPEAIRLTVRDQGLGIAKQDRARIFERFEQAVSERHYGGLGLGLWVTRQIVEAMGGTIFVTGELGQGSTFIVEWPRST